MRIVALDTETGGLLPRHPIIQVAGIAIEGGRELETFERKIAFDVAQVDPAALELNHYEAAAWKDAVSERAAMTDLAAFLNRHRSVTLVSKRTGNPYTVARLMGHNVSFDVDRLGAAFKRHNLFFPVDYGSILDTRYGSIWACLDRTPPPRDYKLTTLAEYFGLPVDGAHDALVDVRLSIALARKLRELGSRAAA